MRLACALAIAIGICGCGGDERDALSDARSKLSDAAYRDAAAAAEAGLGRSPDAVTAWGLELVKLEALARGGDAEAVKAQLEQLARRHPERVPATQYSATAHQLRTAGQRAAAIEVLDMGLQRYPGNATIERLIGQAAAAEVDSAELEMLRSLGYID